MAAPVEMVMSQKPLLPVATPEKMNSLLAIHIFCELFIFTCFLLFYDDDVGVRCTGEMVAIEIYVHKHSFLSLQLLTVNWYFAISPAQPT